MPTRIYRWDGPLPAKTPGFLNSPASSAEEALPVDGELRRRQFLVTRAAAFVQSEKDALDDFLDAQGYTFDSEVATFDPHSFPTFVERRAADLSGGDLNAGNVGRTWYNTTSRQVKTLVDDGLGGFSVMVMGETVEEHRLVVAKSGGDFATIQAALDAIADAASVVDFNDDTKARYVVDVYPGVYTENLSIPTRQAIEIHLHAAKIVGNVTWSLDGTVMTGTKQQAKLLIVGHDLRNAYNSSGMAMTGTVEGNVEVNVIGGVGSLNFAQLDLINAGVTGNITGTLPGGGVAFTLQLFCENAIVGGSGAGATGFVCDAGVAGTLYCANSDTSSSFAFGKVNGQINLNALRNVRFRGPVDVNSTHGRWFNVEFASGLAHDFTGSSGTIAADSNSFNSYSDNVPVKGAETFNLIDTPRFMQVLAADPAATAANRARFWYNSVDRQVKAVVDDGAGGFTVVILG